MDTPLSTDAGTNFDTVYEDQERDSKSTSQSLHEDDTDRVSLIEKWEILMDNLRCAWYYDRPFAADDDKALWDFSLFSRSMIVLTLMILFHVFAVRIYE